MTVASVKITSWDANETIDSVEYRVSYLITTNDRNDGPAIVQAALPVARGDTYASGNETDNRASLSSVSITQADPANFYAWNVDTIFRSMERRAHPIFDPIQESVSWNGVEESSNYYFDGSPIVNTAGEFFDEKEKKIDNRPVITYSLNQLTFPWALAQQIRNSVNSATWKGFPARTVKLQSMGTERVYDGLFGIYYRVSYTFEVNPATFDFARESEGTYQLEHIDAVPNQNAKPGVRFVRGKPAHEALVAILVGVIPIKVPVALDINGRAVSEGLGQEVAIVRGTLYQPFDYNYLFSFLI